MLYVAYMHERRWNPEANQDELGWYEVKTIDNEIVFYGPTEEVTEFLVGKEWTV